MNQELKLLGIFMLGLAKINISSNQVVPMDGVWELATMEPDDPILCLSGVFIEIIGAASVRP